VKGRKQRSKEARKAEKQGKAEKRIQRGKEAEKQRSWEP